MHVHRLAMTALALVLSITAASAQQCNLEGLDAVKVASVRDGRTLMLDDGRELRLAAIEIADDIAARSALQSLTGATLTLKKLGTGRDRYGRIVAFAFPPGATGAVQQTLLAAGAAIVAGRVGDKACAAELLAFERAAREQKRGIWADPSSAPMHADDGASVAAQRGRFTVIEGQVLSVRESGSTIYVNFGRRWSRDFSVTISKRNQRMFAAAGLDPKSLDGRRVRVRGWVEQRSGPIIEATRPEQIEIID
jgi:endonuclease YncB( thermonuclease family)